MLIELYPEGVKQKVIQKKNMKYNVEIFLYYRQFWADSEYQDSDGNNKIFRFQ